MNEYEKNRQKIKLKELNGLDTTQEDAKEVMLSFNELTNNVPLSELSKLADISRNNKEQLKNAIPGLSKLPLVAITQLLPYIKRLHDDVTKDTNMDTKSKFVDACNELAKLSNSLVGDDEELPYDESVNIGPEDLKGLPKEEIREKLDKLFKETMIKLITSVKEKDNGKICDYASALWNISNMTYIFM